MGLNDPIIEISQINCQQLGINITVTYISDYLIYDGKPSNYKNNTS